MDLEYRGELRIKHERTHPKKLNSCRASVIANAINFFYGRSIFTPETIVSIVDSQRMSRGLPPLDLDADAITDEEVVALIGEYGPRIGVAEVEGRACANPALWEELLNAGFLIAPDHQLIYSDPLVLERNDLYYLPIGLPERLVHGKEFSYQTFFDLYSFYIAHSGKLDEGHIDIVLDLQNVAGLDSIVLANLATKGNEYPLFVPWHFFINYLFFDWSGPSILDPADLPNETEMRELFEKGTVLKGERSFFFASMEIYYSIEKKPELDAILKKYA